MHKAKAFFYVCAGLFLLALAYHMGARIAAANASTTLQEVAVLSGQVPDGGTIPLPQYQDGTEALETECQWIASVRSAASNFSPMYGVWCYTTGRVVSVGAGGGQQTANYLIIATRTSGPVPTHRESFGAIKSRYRGAPGAAQTGTHDR